MRIVGLTCQLSMRWGKKSKADRAIAKHAAEEQAQQEMKLAQAARLKLEAEAERQEIFRLLEVSKGGADASVLKERRRSRSKDTPFVTSNSKAVEEVDASEERRKSRMPKPRESSGFFSPRPSRRA